MRAFRCVIQVKRGKVDWEWRTRKHQILQWTKIFYFIGSILVHWNSFKFSHIWLHFLGYVIDWSRSFICTIQWYHAPTWPKPYTGRVKSKCVCISLFRDHTWAKFWRCVTMIAHVASNPGKLISRRSNGRKTGKAKKIQFCNSYMFITVGYTANSIKVVFPKT